MKNCRYLTAVLVIMFAYGTSLLAQQLEPHEFPRGDMRIMFYNAENLFDVYDDSTKTDEDFTPEGAKHWTPAKYQKKLNNLSKVITAIGQWEHPEIVGFCEIENRFVLDELLRKTALKNFNYRIIHKESPDNRGIDVGLLYRADKFNPIEFEAVRVVFPFDANKPTRDILYVKGKTATNDTLHIFVNHWPSRWGGQMASDEKRMYAASVVKHKTDSIFKAEKHPKIIVMGDLNDYPQNNSLVEVLQAQTKFDKIDSEKLYNLGYYLQEIKSKGSHKHEGEWGVLDQIIVSGFLLNSTTNLSSTIDDAHVFDAPFLLEPDETYTGFQNFRTYIGMTFHDGFSDHLPVYIDLWFK